MFIKSLEDSGVFIDGVTETVKYKIKNQEGGFRGAYLALLAASLVHPLSNIEITKHFNYNPRLNRLPRNNLPE